MKIVQTAERPSQLSTFIRLYWRDAIIFLIPVGVALFHDIHRHFLTSPDGDVPFVASALRMNSGMEQLYTGHTGYVLFVLLSWWFKLMSLFGVVATSTMEGLPPPRSDAFVVVFRDLVFAARYFIAFGAGALALMFYRLCIRLTAEQTVAFLIALMFALSRPVGTQALMIYTELPSSFFLLAAFFVIAVPGHERRPLLRVFLIGAFAMLAMMSKMQAVGYLLGLVVLALGFGPDRDMVRWPQVEGPRRWLRNLFALALIVPAAHMIATSVIWNSIEGASHNGWYHALIIIFTLGALFVWGWIYRVPVALRIDAALMLAAGLAAAWYTHLLNHTMVVTEKLANFLDHLYFMSSMKRFEASDEAIAGGLVKLGPLIRRALDGIQVIATERIVISDWRVQALDLLTLPVLLGGLWLLYRRETRLAVMVILLSGFSFAAEVFSRLYRWGAKHEIYHAPWLLIAAALLAAYFYHRLEGAARVSAIAVCLVFIALVAWGVSLPDMINAQEYGNAYGEATGYAPSIAEGFLRFTK